MSRPPSPSALPGAPPRRPSRALFGAALGGLLCMSGTACGAKPVVTSSKVVPDMTLSTFTSQCDAKNGKVEVHPHCAGANSCRGMSYDTGTHVLTEHTCKGMNACAGYSCVVPS